jgi:hypothetical protein
MNELIFQSDRYFVLHGYSPSHGHLLIRSDKKSKYKENIDIVFFDTAFMQLYAMLSGITIKVVEKERFTQYLPVSKYLSFKNNNLFEIESENEKYYVAASHVKVFSNDLAFNESSIGLFPRGLDNEIASSH